ncbi:uncharacterized protein LOC126902857 [Daktulosphaira vitifoliae]|uniref:uncharacterized protein LOC126902857 n=1 Tax=Daktulosphaira vitifoliae TaxID=58002 RepID=UPI0021AA57DE|nr:uncharacterized protein LOC126902857 [Daktulosphaira vitifoliae]
MEIDIKISELKSAVLVLSSPFMSLALISTVVNVFSIDPDAPISWAVIIIMNMFAYSIWIYAVYGVNKKSCLTVQIASTLWVSYIFLWVMAVIFAVGSDSGVKYVCSKQKCPESLWLCKNEWHKIPVNNVFHSDYMMEYANDNVRPAKIKKLESRKRDHNSRADKGFVIGTVIFIIILILNIYGFTLLTRYTSVLARQDNCCSTDREMAVHDEM